MKEVDIYRIFLPILFIIFAVILEMINFLYLGFQNSNGDLLVFPTYFLFDLGIICMLAGVIYFVTNCVAIDVLYYIFLGFQAFMNIANATMYGVFGDILSFDLLRLGAEATAAVSAEFIDWWSIVINFLAFGVILAVTIIFEQKEKGTITYKKVTVPVVFLAVFVLFQGLGAGLFALETNSLQVSVSAETEIEKSDEYLWDNFQFKLDAFKKFGYYGFYTKSVLKLIFKDKVEDESVYVEYIDDGYVAKNEDAPLYGDNLIVILCESLDWYAIDPYNTPTLWKLVGGEDTMVFKEFYGRNRTNISEAITLLGGVSKNIMNDTVCKTGYEFQYSLPNLFKSTTNGEDVVTSYFHPNNGSFYDRIDTHGKDGIGFDNLYFIEDYTGEQEFTKFGEWIQDIDFISNLIDEFMPQDKRFLSFFASLSTHGAYTYDQKYFDEYYQIFDENYDKFSEWFTENTSFIIPEDEGDFEQFRRYKSSMIDFERTVAYILDELENRNLKDNTSILFFADHNSYFSNLCYKIKGVDKEDYSNTYINNIPMFIYSPKLENEWGGEFDNLQNTFCNHYDLLPTICDLYGLPSNTNLFQGYSIFSDEIENTIFVSNLSGMFTKNIFSFNISDVVIVGENVTLEEIDKFKKNANRYWKQQEYLEIILANGINGSVKF